MRVSFSKWWLLPFGILATSALIALGVVVFQPSAINRSFAAIAPQMASGQVVECSGTLVADYACLQQRYQGLVRGPGVKAAFAELKDEYGKNNFVQVNCHQLTHVVGRAAADLYGDVPGTYAQGDDFCSAGYYHGAMETFVAKIGPDKILEEANALCADLSERQEHSYYHRNCVHGLGHGFMAALEGDVFESLEACDTLKDGWEKEHCYGGTFMENVMSQSNPSVPSKYPSKYLKADQLSYPCTDVETRYKNQCYKRQTPYVLGRQGGNFAKVFDFCGGVEEDFRSACYQGMGWDIGSLSINGESFTNVAETELPGKLCTMGRDYEARSNCIAGAAKFFVQFYNDQTQYKELCESLNSKLRAVCLQAGEEYSKTFEA